MGVRVVVDKTVMSVMGIFSTIDSGEAWLPEHRYRHPNDITFEPIKSAGFLLRRGTVIDAIKHYENKIETIPSSFLL